MKNINKKICALFAAIALIAMSALSACAVLLDDDAVTDKSALVDSTVYVTTEDVTADLLMSTRTKIRSSNIYITTTYYQSNAFMHTTIGTSLGSGVVFDEDDNNYYALTNNHVITNVFTDTTTNRTYNCTVTYAVTDINGVNYTGTLVMADGDDNDIAIISFPKKSTAAQLGLINYTARLNDNVVEKEFVLAVGNPSGVKNVVTYGEIIGLTKIETVSYKVINHNALINSGNSGGALCDINGNLLGLNTWGITGTDEDNYSIPLAIINEFINEFNASREVAA